MASGERTIVQLVGGAPWGFRLQGGAGTGKPLEVSKIRRKSRAHHHLQEGDLMVTINDVPCESKTHDEAMAIVDEAKDALNLEIIRPVAGKENVHPPIEKTVTKTQNETEFQKTTSHSRQETSSSQVENSTKTFEQQTFEGPRLQSKLIHEPETKLPTFDSLPQTTVYPLFPPNTAPLVGPEPKLADVRQPVFQCNQAPLRPPFGIIGSPADDQKEVSVETTSDPNNFHQVTTERSRETHGNTQTSSFKQEEKSFSRQEQELGQPCQVSPFQNFGLSGAPTTTTSESSGLFQVTKFETKQSSSVDSQTMWRPTSPIFGQPLEAPLPELRGPSPIVDLFGIRTNQPQASSAPLGEKPAKVPPAVLPKPKPIRATPAQDSSAKDIVQTQETITSQFGTSSSEFTDLRTTVSSSSDFFSSSASHAYQASSDTEDTDMGSESLLSRRRKTFSSSSFYEEPGCIYPTVEEQVELCRKIADSLSADTNVKSKGANMFYKRVKRSHKWIHAASDAYLSDGATTDTEYEPMTPDPSQLAKAPYIKVSTGPPKLKLILDPREILDMQKLRNSGQIINEHNAVSPDICMDLVRDLNSPCGKGAALFAKRKQKAEEWVVDEEKVKAKTKIAQQMAADSQEAYLSAQKLGITYQNQRVKLVKTPWEAALESPIGSCDGAFIEVSPVFGSYMAQSIIQAAENKISRSMSPCAFQGTDPRGNLPQMQPAYVPVAPISVDIYRPKNPRGWMGTIQDNVPTARVEPNPLPQPPLSFAPADSVSLPTIPNAAPRPASFHDFNTLPRSWSKNKGSSQGAFRPVKAPSYI